MGKPLTAELIRQKTKTEQIHLIKNLNLWGNDIDDLQIIQQMPNLEVLSLSVNKISTLKDLNNCNKLQELYLRKNNISDIREIKHLLNLPNLKVLWLQDNPCSETENYRETVIKSFPNMTKFDNIIVTPEEKINAQKINIDHILSYSPQKQENNAYDDIYYQQQQQEAQYNYEEQQIQQQQQNQQQQQFKQNNPQQQFDRAQLQEDYMQQQNKLQKKQSAPIQSNNNQYQQQQQQSPQLQKQSSQGLEVRNENIVCAILALLKELDESSLEIVRRDVERKIGNLRMNK